MDIGKIIKEERIARNMTQEDLAQHFFVTRQLISKWENGKSYPDLKQVVQLSELFDISLEGLLKEDTGMVNKLTFDIKQKKIFKIVISLLISIATGAFFYFTIIWWIDSVPLSMSDIEITAIEKNILPEKKVVIERTGEIVTLPEDVEYTIYFKTNRWMVNLYNIAGQKTYSDDKGILVEVSGERHLYKNKKESKIIIQSERETNPFTTDLNIGKSIYLYNLSKASDLFDHSKMKEPTVSQLGDELSGIKELDKLPDNHSE
jgi:transcriptional regulator with XRE-family HTH domain